MLRTLLELLTVSLVCAVLLIIFASALVRCGPVTVQIRQEHWQCEVKQESSDGTVDFRGCRRDGTDVQDSDQPDSGPEVTVPKKISNLLN